jgi:hypothetical protein
MISALANFIIETSLLAARRILIAQPNKSTRRRVDAPGDVDLLVSRIDCPREKIEAR